MYSSPSKNNGGDRDLRKGAISPEEMAAIIRQLEEAKLLERQRAAKKNPTKKALFPETHKPAPTKSEPKAEPYPTRDGDSYGPPPPAPTRPTFMFFME